ncbi:MAG: dihydroneopterin aldolase [Candidatus Saccharibacteria bacterium]
MDKIIMKGLSFLCHLGITEEERTKAQPVVVDLVLHCDLLAAGLSDNLNDTVNYHTVFDRVKKIMETNSYNLLEGMAEAIAAHILVVENLVEKVEVTIKKTKPPVEGHFEYFGVSIERTRDV